MKKLIILLMLLALISGCTSIPKEDITGFRYAIEDESYVTAYYDHGDRIDWNCGSKTYSGHKGTDFGIGSWGPMDEGVEVYAAADGVVLMAVDGKYDRCTGREAPSPQCTGAGNYVKIEHADGTITYYMHLKQWSVTV